jgi:3-methyladenine DNA glycosylase AlkC
VDVDRLIGLSWASLRREAEAYAAFRPHDLFESAVQWYGHDAWEIRYFAVSVLGRVSTEGRRALEYLYGRCGEDGAWQIHEALAMAIDDYCAVKGYEECVPEMRRWLSSPHPSIRRAVSEGLRPWTASKRAYFAEHPERAIELLGTLRDDVDRKVQESVGNALRDIGRKYFDLVLETVRRWVEEEPDSPARRVIAKYALEKAVKDDPGLRSIYEMPGSAS